MSTRQAERHGAAQTSPSGPAAERRRIVAGKLAAPPLRPGIVDRPRLLDGLLSATHSPVTLVSAPAGYGKTTLLALWRERDRRPSAWVSLEAADNATRSRWWQAWWPRWIQSWASTPRSATASPPVCRRWRRLSCRRWSTPAPSTASRWCWCWTTCIW